MMHISKLNNNMGTNLQSLQGVNKQTYMKGSKAQFIKMVEKKQGIHEKGETKKYEKVEKMIDKKKK